MGSYDEENQDLKSDRLEVPFIEAQVAKEPMICTILLIVINTIVYFLCLKLNYDTAAGGTNYRDVIEYGEYGRLLSSMFLHSGSTHLISNMLALFLFGKFVEEKQGSFQTFVIYFVSGIGAGLCSVFLNHIIEPNRWVYSIGASGAISGIITSCLYLNAKRQGIPWVRAMLCVGLYIAADFAGTDSQGIDIFGHLGGAVVGLLIAVVISLMQNTEKREGNMMKALGIALTLLFSVVAVNEANFGEIPHWNAERIAFIQQSEEVPNIPLGDALDAFCSETEWDAFLTKQGEEIVEFRGNCNYEGQALKLRIQFTLDMVHNDYEINYFAFDEKAQTGRVMDSFFQTVYQSYLHR